MTPTPMTHGKSGDHPGVDGTGRPKLVVGIDGSTTSWDAFAWAAGEANRSNGLILAVFVTPLIEPVEALGSTAPLGYADAAKAREQMTEELEAEVARRADALCMEVSFVRATGDATRVLTEVARSQHADLIVVGRSAKMLHRLAGSVGRRLVMSRDSPVLVVVP